jgi:tellurite resistance protein TehA-like permease
MEPVDESRAFNVSLWVITTANDILLGVKFSMSYWAMMFGRVGFHLGHLRYAIPLTMPRTLFLYQWELKA